MPLEKTENIASIPDLGPVPDALELPVALKVGDDSSTDDIVPAGNRVMPCWSNIPRLGEFVYEEVDAGYAARARASLAAAGHACYAYCDSHLVNAEHAVILDVEATTALRQAEVGAARAMLTRTAEAFGLWPERLVADTGYGPAAMLGWLVHERGVEPHIPVFDKSARQDGTSSREAFRYDREGDVHFCPAGKMLSTRGTVLNDDRVMYRSSAYDCAACALKPRCCPNKPSRRVPRSIHEGARDMARHIARTEPYAISRRERKGRDAVRAPQAHPPPGPAAGPVRRPRRVPPRRRSPAPP